MSQPWAPPAPSRAVALLAAAGLLCALAPVLAIASFVVVGFSIDALLEPADACRTYACGEGMGFALVLFSVGWMVVIWVAGLVVASIATWGTVSVVRAIAAASITALVVTVVAVAVDWAWVVWSV